MSNWKKEGESKSEKEGLHFVSFRYCVLSLRSFLAIKDIKTGVGYFFPSTSTRA